jgi:hypothetical protein
MNILKHMEAAFIIALAVAGTASAVAEARDQVPAQIMDTSIATPTQMAVVTVKAKRLTAAQKLDLALDQHRAAKHA